ncbi:MAG TPA: TIGR03016 family PEP-CTERM system-associated outer membrane protein [Burkholderiales bacterium]|nr:TIGR03016 family PEP-CTERM system-associated outer membrane protein [Burkholderiales bacterium]
MWEIVPTLTVAETYTDNISLTPDAAKQTDWVTQVIPSVSVVATGARLRFNATYSPEITYYARGQKDNQVYQRLNATGTAELAKQLLFVDAGAKVDQYNVSLQGPITDSNVYTTGNRSTVKTLFASPYLKHDFGDNLSAEARYTYSVVDSDDTSGLSDSVANRVDLLLASGPAYKVFTWDLSYSRENTDYSDRLFDNGFEVSSASARRLITPTLGLLASVGYEDYFSTIGRASEGLLWSAGFDWAPTPRTRLVATAGERFYDNTYFLDFNHRTRLTTWGAGYSETITTTRNEFFIPAISSTSTYVDTLFTSRFPDPVARQKAVEEFIARTGLPPSLNAPINVFVNTRFLQKRSNASAGIVGVRNVLIANVFEQTVEGLAGNQVLPDAPNASIQTGAGILWNWRMTAQNAWNLGAAYSRNETPNTGEIGYLTFVTMGINRQFQPRLSGSLHYRFQQNDSNFGVNDYTENAVLATLQMGF